MRAHMRVSFDTGLSPERVIAALTDFSENRPATWPSLDPNKYEVYEVGETTALIKEGSRTPNVWARERYDWSQPGMVSWTLEESNVFRPGTTIELLAEPNGHGGSHVEMDGSRVATSLVGHFVVAGLAVFGRSFVLSTYKRVFDRVAAAEK